MAKVPDYLKIPNVKLHLYGKRDARPGRKMGHVTFLNRPGKFPTFSIIFVCCGEGLKFTQAIGLPLHQRQFAFVHSELLWPYQ